LNYKVKNIDIRYKKKTYPEGSIIELDEKNAKILSQYLEPITEDEKQEEPKNKKGKKTEKTEPEKLENPETPEKKEDN